MKIAIPVEKQTLNINICQVFGRAPYFLIYDTETKKRNIIENNGLNQQGGARNKSSTNYYR